MGTRHLIAVQANNEYKIAQYGQWDGYPSGQGATVLSFLSNQENIQRLRDSITRIRFLDFDGQDKKLMEEYNNNCPTWSSDTDNRTAEQKRLHEDFWSRDIGADILTNVINSSDEEILLINEIDFAKDSLFCEWAYVVDLDACTLEVYTGFQRGEVEGRFKSKPDSDYSAVALIRSYSLNDLPTLEDFLNDLSEDDEEAA